MNTTDTALTRSEILNAAIALAGLAPFIGRSQRSAINAGLESEEGRWFADKIAELTELVATMPKSYETDGQGAAAVAHLHYFAGGEANWYITERDRSIAQHQAFGKADLFSDGGELGYISITEIIAHGGELDLHWTPKALSAIN